VQAIVTLRSGKKVDNKMVNPEEAEEEEQKEEGRRRKKKRVTTKKKQMQSHLLSPKI
jgi:hypothetical protein